MRIECSELESLIKLYPPAPGCRNQPTPHGPDQRIVGLCYHHADLRSRLIESGRLTRSERLYLVRLELTSRSESDKRRYQRHAVDLPADLHFGTDVLTCTVTDVGSGGIGVEAPRLPTQAGLVYVSYRDTLWLPVASFAICWSRVYEQTHRAGLRIVSVPEYLLPTPLRGPESRTHRSGGNYVCGDERLGCSDEYRAPCYCKQRAIPLAAATSLSA